MNAQSCCVGTGRSSYLTQAKTRRVKGATQWGAPALILLLLPKCPMCVAAYVVMITGVGLSFEAAAWLRAGLIAICVLAIGLLATRLVYHRLASR